MTIVAPFDADAHPCSRVRVRRIQLSLDGSSAALEAAFLSGSTLRFALTDPALVGRHVKLIRRDTVTGETGCTAAHALATTDGATPDFGGVLTLDPVSGLPTTQITLVGLVDGTVDNDLFDNVISLSGAVSDSATFELCLSDTTLPTSDVSYTHYGIPVRGWVRIKVGRESSTTPTPPHPHQAH